MKKVIFIVCSAFVLACNNTATETKEPTPDTSASSSADSILKAVEKMKADSAAMLTDSSKKDSIKK